MKKANIMLFHLIRRDRVKLIFWIFGLVAFSAAGASPISELYGGSKEQLIGMYETLQNPAMIALLGPTSASVDNYTVGALYAHEMILFTVIIFAIISILHVVARTRGEEDAGTTELIRSFEVGKLANTTAVIGEMFLIHVMMAFLIGIVIQSQQIATMDDFSSNLLFGATLSMQGFIWCCIALLYAQLSNSAAGAKGLSFATLGLFYMARIGTDMNNADLSWLNPLSWSYLVDVYVSDNWLPIIFGAVFASVLIITSCLLELSRDVGAGYFPERTGRKSARTSLLSLRGLVLRLNRTFILSWLVGLFILGITYGSVFGDMDMFIEGNDLLEQMFLKDGGVSIQEQFMAVLFLLVSLITAVFAISTLMKLVNEEKKGFLDQLYAMKLGRKDFYCVYLGLALILAIVGQFTAILGLYIAQVNVMTEPLPMLDIIKAGVIWLPAIFFMIALLALLIGFSPRITAVIWLYLGFSFFISYLGALMNLPDWFVRLDVFSYIPRIPVEEMNITNIVVLTVLALLFMVIGFIGYKNRDLIAG